MIIKKMETIERQVRLPHNIRSMVDGFVWAIQKKNTSAVIIVDGKSGLGKTTLACQIGKYCDDSFSLSKLHYNPETFLKGSPEGKIGLEQAKKGDVILFDEAMLLSNRASLSIINRMIVQAMSMIRSKNIIVIFCVNSIFDIDKNLAIHRADVLYHLYGDSLVDRGKVMAFFKGLDGRDRLKELYLNGKKYYDYAKPKSNFNTTFNKYFPFDEVEYERQKQVGITEFLSGENRGNNKREIKSLEGRNRYIEWLIRNSDLTQEEIAKIGNIEKKTVYRAHDELKDNITLFV